MALCSLHNTISEGIQKAILSPHQRPDKGLERRALESFNLKTIVSFGKFCHEQYQVRIVEAVTFTNFLVAAQGIFIYTILKE
mmetsp:Transcript_34128/g.69677  ORF Transcript_34128/g.69677 Transcript_34128/m.69677 type:complete len:82 (-) Transcript_34128:81-326(-)